MSKSSLFKDGSIGRPFIEANASMQKFLSKIDADSSKDSYTFAMYQYCRAIGKSPDQLLEERKLEDESVAADEAKGIKGKKATNGYNALDQAQDFIKSGVVKTVRVYPSGKRHERTILIANLSRKRRELLYAAIKSFYKVNRVALPAEKFAIKVQQTDEQAIKSKTTYMPLNQAKAIISACKTPYRELFSCMMYGGFGRREVLLINKMWPLLVEQVKAAKDPNYPIMLNYNFRKVQTQEERAFFTFVPAKVLLPFVNDPMPWMVRVHGGKGKKEPLQPWHYLKPWHLACKRACIKEKIIPHFFRDLMITDGVTDAKIPELFVQFLTGHSVDPNQYLQLSKKPEFVLREWQKWRAYVDAENPTLQGEVKAMTEQLTSFQEENKLLRDEVIANLTEQLEMVQVELAEEPDSDDPNHENMRKQEANLINRLGKLGVVVEPSVEPKVEAPRPVKPKRVK